MVAPDQQRTASTPLARWAALVGLSLVIAGALELLRLPAALLLGPLVAGVILATRGLTVAIPRPAFALAQGVVGVMIASNLPPSILTEIAADWPIFLVGTLSTLGAASLLGWLMARSRLLPGTTAIWGSSPGAATVMTLMSEGYGADMRLVALMQYLRVACVAAVAAVMARLIGTPDGSHAAAIAAVATPADIAGTLALVGLGTALGARLRLAGGPLLVPMAAGLAVKFTGLMPIVLPGPVLALGYAAIGWGIGMRFTPEVLGHAARAFPRVFASILVLIASCGGVAALLVVFAGVDPLTAYLATSPGGADSVSIIAASTRVDVPFVISMQMARFICIVLFGPMLARALSRPRSRR